MSGAASWSELLASSATEYCHLIDHIDTSDENWLDSLAALLPRIHAAISALPEHKIDQYPAQSGHDLDRRFELFSRLRKLLGDSDSYALDFDEPELQDEISGSLADDFTDIYFELKKGLELLGPEPQTLSKAVDLWYGTYLWHWGQHLVDAEKHLYDLKVHRRLAHN
jgi:hypothetical protein